MNEIFSPIIKKIKEDFSGDSVVEVDGKLSTFPLPAISPAYRNLLGGGEFVIKSRNGQDRRFVVRKKITSNKNIDLIGLPSVITPQAKEIDADHEMVEIPLDSIYLGLLSDTSDLGLPEDKAQAVYFVEKTKKEFEMANPTLERELRKLYGQEFSLDDAFAVSVSSSSLILLV